MAEQEYPTRPVCLSVPDINVLILSLNRTVQELEQEEAQTGQNNRPPVQYAKRLIYRLTVAKEGWND